MEKNILARRLRFAVSGFVAAVVVFSTGAFTLAGPVFDINQHAGYVNEEGQKCGINAAKPSNWCGWGKYRLSNFTCHDGSEWSIGDANTCMTAATAHEIAASVCFEKCVAPVEIEPGMLTLEESPVLPSTREQLVFGGQEDVTLATIELHLDSVESAELDSIEIEDVRNDGTVDTYYFYINDELVGSVPGGVFAQLFLDNDQVILDGNSESLLTVKADMVDVGSLFLVNGIDVENGNSVQVEVARPGDIQLTGEVSNAGIENRNGDVGGPRTYMYESYPRVELVQGWTNEAAVGSIGSGMTSIARFRVYAVGNEDVTFESEDWNTLTVFYNSVVQDEDQLTEFVLQDLTNGMELDSQLLPPGTNSTTFYFETNDLTIPSNGFVTLEVQVDLTQFEDNGDNIQMYLTDDSTENIDWGVNSVGSFNHADVIFRGDMFGRTFVKSS